MAEENTTNTTSTTDTTGTTDTGAEFYITSGKYGNRVLSMELCNSYNNATATKEKHAREEFDRKRQEETKKQASLIFDKIEKKHEKEREQMERLGEYYREKKAKEREQERLRKREAALEKVDEEFSIEREEAFKRLLKELF